MGWSFRTLKLQLTYYKEGVYKAAFITFTKQGNPSVYLVLFFFRLSPDDHLSHHVINSALQTSNNYKWCQTQFQETFYTAR